MDEPVVESQEPKSIPETPMEYVPPETHPVRYMVYPRDGKVNLTFDQSITTLVLGPKDTMKLARLLREAAHEIPGVKDGRVKRGK